MRFIIHLDIDAFFASAATILKPEIAGRPVAISPGNNRSVVASCSYEARKLGVKAGMPVFKAKEICPEIIFVNPDPNYYQYLSSQLFKHLYKKYSKLIEIASIDECYLDVTHLAKNWNEFETIAREIQRDILETLKLRVSLGLSFNKFSAKMATNLKKPFGISIINHDNFQEKLWSLDIKDFFGIGIALAPRMKKIEIYKIGDLAKRKYDDPSLKSIMGINANKIIDLANGIGSSEVITNEAEAKVISKSRTFPESDLSESKDIMQYIQSFCETISRKLEIKNLLANKVGISIRYSGSKKTRVTILKARKLKTPISSFQDIFRNVSALFIDNWDGTSIRAIGVSVTDLQNKYDSYIQQSIFNYIYQDEKSVQSIIKKINKKFREQVLVTGLQQEDIEKKDRKEQRTSRSSFSNVNKV